MTIVLEILAVWTLLGLVTAGLWVAAHAHCRRRYRRVFDEANDHYRQL